MTDRSISELNNGEIVPGQGGPNAWLVRFGPEEYDLINKTPKHRLLIEDDVLDNAEGGDTRQLDSGEHVTFTADFANDTYKLTVDGRQVTVPSEHENAVLNAYSDNDWEQLAETHKTIVSNRVRVGLMDRFMPRFSEARDTDRLKKTDEGWVIDGTFVVRWDGKNYLTKDVDTHVVDGGETVRADDSRQARVLNFDSLADEIDVDIPSSTQSDTTVTLSRREAKFLATAECLLNPNEYLTDEEVSYVEDAVESVQDPIAAAARTANVQAFTDEKSGLYHSHGLQKHRLGDLGVTDAARERLFYNDFDHAGVHEMSARRGEFESAPYAVFEDAPNDSSEKWKKIESTSKKAPIPSHVRSDIDQRFQ